MLNLGEFFLNSGRPIASGDILFSGLMETFIDINSEDDSISLSVSRLHDIPYNSGRGSTIVERFLMNLVDTYNTDSVDENELDQAISDSASLQSNPSVYDVFAGAFEYFEESVGDINNMDYPVIAIGGDYYNSGYNPHRKLLFDRAYTNYIKSEKVLGNTEEKIQHDVIFNSLENLFLKYTKQDIIDVFNSDINSDTCTKALSELSWHIADYVYNDFCMMYGLDIPEEDYDEFAANIQAKFDEIVDGANEMRENEAAPYSEYEYCNTFADVISYFDSIVVEDFVK